MRFKNWFSGMFALACVVIAILFFALGLLVSQHFLSKIIDEMALERHRNTERIGMLESFIQKQTAAKSADFISLLTPPMPVAVAPETPDPKQLTVSRSPVPVQALAKVTPIPDRKNAVPVTSTASAVIPSKTTLEPAPAVPAPAVKVEPPSANSGDELMASIKNNALEGVQADKAGILNMGKDSVTMRGGVVIRVGQTFPSGEKLLLVDRENGRIVTNQRQLLIFN